MSPVAHARRSARRSGGASACGSLLALEFELAADIVRSVIAPTWKDIGELAAIAVIRTFLNYFLEKDLEAARLKLPRSDVNGGIRSVRIDTARA